MFLHSTAPSVNSAAGFSMVTVLVTCSLETLRKREKERGNRFEGSAEASLRYLYPKEGYDLRIDNDHADPAASAEKILQRTDAAARPVDG